MIGIWYAYQSWKFVGDEENNIPFFLVTLGERHNKMGDGRDDELLEIANLSLNKQDLQARLWKYFKGYEPKDSSHFCIIFLSYIWLIEVDKCTKFHSFDSVKKMLSI